MTDTFPFRIGTTIETPMGKGTVQGAYITGDLVLVRIPIPGSETDERCVTPTGKPTSLWSFPTTECKIQ